MSAFTEISSPQNPRYKTWLKLLDARGIKKNSQALVSGRSFIHEILERHGARVEAVLVRKPQGAPCGPELLEGLTVPQRCPVFALPGEMFAELDIYGIRGPILQISAPQPEEWDGLLSLPEFRAASGRATGMQAAVMQAVTKIAPEAEILPGMTIGPESILTPVSNNASNASPAAPGAGLPGFAACSLTVFVPFQNPINLGTTIRSAAAFGAGVVLMKEAATPYLPKSLRASGPGIFQVPLYRGPDLKELSGMDLPIFALSPRGKSIYEFDFMEICKQSRQSERRDISGFNAATLEAAGASAAGLNVGGYDNDVFSKNEPDGNRSCGKEPGCSGLDGKGPDSGSFGGIGLVAGLEGPGLDEYWPEERRISIPMRPCVESLNASVSMSIAMAFFQAAMQRKN